MSIEISTAIRALDSKPRLQILGWLKNPRAYFPPQVYGDLVRDGVCAHLVKGERRCLVDPDKGWIWRIEFEGEDTLGRRIEAVGQQHSNHGTSTGLFLWTWNGARGWGENQGGIAPSYPRVKRDA